METIPSSSWFCLWLWVLISTSLRTFALIVTPHPYCTHKFECRIMHRVCARSAKRNNDRAHGHCYGFTWILQSWMFGDPFFSFQKQILFTIISTLSENEHKNQCGKLKKFQDFCRRDMEYCHLARETMVTKCKFVVWGTSTVG